MVPGTRGDRPGLVAFRRQGMGNLEDLASGLTEGTDT